MKLNNKDILKVNVELSNWLDNFRPILGYVNCIGHFVLCFTDWSTQKQSFGIFECLFIKDRLHTENINRLDIFKDNRKMIRRIKVWDYGYKINTNEFLSIEICYNFRQNCI